MYLYCLISSPISVLAGFAGYTGLRVERLKLSGFLGNWESWRKGQGMSVAEIRPYQPGDTIKQIDRTSTAKKSELMTKLTHQEEQLSMVHVVLGGEEVPQDVLVSLVAGLSYAGLKYGDTVGAILGDHRYAPSRGRAKLTHRFDLLKQGSVEEVSLLEALTVRAIQRCVVCVYISDFPTDPERKAIHYLAQRNTVVMILCARSEVLNPSVGKGYAYEGHDLTPSRREAYVQMIEERTTQFRGQMQAIGGKFVVVDDGSDVMVQLTQQWGANNK